MGAWLKNTACLLDGRRAFYSKEHGDLGSPKSRELLHESVKQFLCRFDSKIDAIAHDLHPDFYSTHLALELGAALSVPAFAVQHHTAHLAAVIAEHGLIGPTLGLALDGVGYGADGTSWGGEILLLQPEENDDLASISRRLDHISSLRMPGGDKAAVEPWRMGLSLLHALAEDNKIQEIYLKRMKGSQAAQLGQLLQKNVNCPISTGCGRWFDAIASLLLGIDKQEYEAHAAMALEACAKAWFAAASSLEKKSLVDQVKEQIASGGSTLLDLFPLASAVLSESEIHRAAAYFHIGLAERLVVRSAELGRQMVIKQIALSGGCFFNSILREWVMMGLESQGFKVYVPHRQSFGDAGLALGQAWVGAQTLHTQRAQCVSNTLSGRSVFGEASHPCV